MFEYTIRYLESVWEFSPLAVQAREHGFKPARPFWGWYLLPLNTS